MNKSDLRNVIVQKLREELARQTSAAELARDEAISEESRAESKWDTHSQEAAYLAEGQAKLAGEIGESIQLYTALPLPAFAPGSAIALGAVVALASGPATNPKTSWFFFGPRGGGLELKVGDREILVLTPQSPLGRQLLGKGVGDIVHTPGRGGKPASQRIAAVE